MNNKIQPVYNDIGKLPPQAIELEEVVLGAIMLEKNAISIVIGELIPESFYKESNKLIYEAILTLYDKNSPIDSLTVTEQLTINENLEIVGGAYYVTQLTSKVASAAHIEYHALIVKQHYISREMIRISSETQTRAYDESEDIADIIDFHEMQMQGIHEIIMGNSTISHISDAVEKSIAELKKREQNYKDGITPGITTGLKGLDDIICGWQPGTLNVIGARPAMGKTALALKFSKSAAQSDLSICIFSLEMTDTSLADRMIIGESGVDANRYKRGCLNVVEWGKVNAARKSLSDLSIFIDDSAAIGLNRIKSVSRLKHKSGQCDMIVIDYLQLLNLGADNKHYNREQEVSMASRGLKALAKELDIPVILLCQLNRSVEMRSGSKKPQLSDLRESGAIEQDSDIVMFPYRPYYYGLTETEDGMSTLGYGEIILAKHRAGAIGEIEFYHNESLTQIEDLPIVEEKVEETISFQDIAETNTDPNDLPF